MYFTMSKASKEKRKNIRCGDMLKESTFPLYPTTPNSRTCRQTSLFPLCRWERLKFTEVRWPNPPHLTHYHFGLPSAGKQNWVLSCEMAEPLWPAVFRLQTPLYLEISPKYARKLTEKQPFHWEAMNNSHPKELLLKSDNRASTEHRGLSGTASALCGFPDPQ